MQFIQIDEVYNEIKRGKKHEEEAFKNLMTIVNGNRFFKQQSKNTMRSFLRSAERSLNKSKSLPKKNSRTIKSLGSLRQGSSIKSRKSKMSFKAASL